MENQIQKVNPINQELISNLVLNGDISKMTNEMKVDYYNKLCHSLSLNPVTKPFQIITFQGKTILYATKDATEQLRKINGVSVVDLQQDMINGLCVSKCKVQDAAGRYDMATGVVNISGLKGDMLANAIMKSETKSKRRATLSICGLGILDESELDTIPDYKTSDISKIKTDVSDFVSKVTGYLQTITKKDELEKAYETAKSRDSYINCSDEDKQKIDEVYVECIGKFIEIPKPEDSDIPFDIPAEEVKAVFSVDDILPDELPEITGLKSCKTLTALNKYYKGITETPTFKQYGADYKAELHETYEAKMKELKAK